MRKVGRPKIKKNDEDLKNEAKFIENFLQKKEEKNNELDIEE